MGDKQERIACSKCGTRISPPENGIVRETTGEIFCQDCTVETDCQICGRDLVISVDQFAEVDGQPVCRQCVSSESAKAVDPRADMDQKDVVRLRSITAIIDLFALGMLASFLVTIEGSWGIIGPVLYDFVVLSTPFFYFIATEAIYGQTPGKMLTGLVVVGKDGSPCSVTQAFVRNLLRIIDIGLLYGVGYAFISASSENQRLGDLVARTVVVKTK